MYPYKGEERGEIRPYQNAHITIISRQQVMMNARDPRKERNLVK